MPTSAPRTTRRAAVRQTAPRDLVLHVALAEIAPPIWRRLRVPDRLTLEQLHRILQLVFGWMDYHLYEFRLGLDIDDLGSHHASSVEAQGPRIRWSIPDPEWDDPELVETRDSQRTTLRELGLAKGAALTYVYDFGDDWVHHIRVEKVVKGRGAEDDSLPMLLDGARAGPPEDAGGVSGYERLIEALADPEDEEHEEMRTWAAGFTGVPYDPERFELVALNHALMLVGAWGSL